MVRVRRRIANLERLLVLPPGSEMHDQMVSRALQQLSTDELRVLAGYMEVGRERQQPNEEESAVVEKCAAAMKEEWQRAGCPSSTGKSMKSGVVFEPAKAR